MGQRGRLGLRRAGGRRATAHYGRPCDVTTPLPDQPGQPRRPPHHVGAADVDASRAAPRAARVWRLHQPIPPSPSVSAVQRCALHGALHAAAHAHAAAQHRCGRPSAAIPGSVSGLRVCAPLCHCAGHRPGDHGGSHGNPAPWPSPALHQHRTGPSALVCTAPRDEHPHGVSAAVVH